MSHPDGDGWGQHVEAHVVYLKTLVAQGKLRASGPATGFPLRSGLLIFTVVDRAELDQLIAGDPFAKENLIANITIVAWDLSLGDSPKNPLIPSNSETIKPTSRMYTGIC